MTQSDDDKKRYVVYESNDPPIADSLDCYGDTIEAAQKYADGGGSTLYHTRVAAFLKGSKHGREAERKRIWEELSDGWEDTISFNGYIEMPASDFKRIIFGERESKP